MRRSFGLIMTVGALLTAAPSHAQTFDTRYPVCMHVYSGANEGGGICAPRGRCSARDGLAVVVVFVVVVVSGAGGRA